jgi:hypothetical protein
MMRSHVNIAKLASAPVQSGGVAALVTKTTKTA